VIATLGRLDTLLASGELDGLVRSAARFVERAVFLTVLHRLLASGADRAAERWRGLYRLPGTDLMIMMVT
jgi:hypothetical protein